MVFRLVAILVMTGLVFPLHAQESDSAALAIFDSALGKLNERSVLLKKWQYYQTLTTQQYDSDGQVMARGTWKSIFRPDEKDPVQYVSEDLEGRLDFFHKAPEPKPGEPRATASAEAVPNNEKADEQSNSRIESLADAIEKFGLRDRYVWTCLPDERAAGERAAVIAFTPKENVPTNSREERFFSQLAGRIWVSRQDSTVLKSEGELTRPFRLFWIIARIDKLSFSYEVEPHPENRLLRGSNARAETLVVFPFYSVRQKHTLDVVKFEPRTPRK